MNEMNAWQAFWQSGSIYDYLVYKSIHDSKFIDEMSENNNENENNGTDNQGTEYR